MGSVGQGHGDSAAYGIDLTFASHDSEDKCHCVEGVVDGDSQGQGHHETSETGVGNEAIETKSHWCGDDYCWSDDDDCLDECDDEYYEPFSYGDGFYQDTFDVVKGIIHDLIINTRKRGVVPEDAEHYLFHVLSICNDEQRTELMTVKKGVHLPLSLACDIGSLELVQFFVQNCNADVNGVNGSPLMWAIIHGHEDIVHYLLECNVDFAMNICTHLNMMMLSMKVFPEGCCEDVGYKIDDEIDNSIDAEPEKSDGEKVSVKFNCKVEIVKMLIYKGAIEASSKTQLFVCVQKLTDYSSEDIHSLCQPLLLDYIENHLDIDSIRNSTGCSLLGYEFKKFIFVRPFTTRLIDMGADIKNANILRFILPQKLDTSNVHTVETNVNHILNSFTVFRELEKSRYMESQRKSYVSVLVFLASRGNSSHMKHCLSMPDFTFQEKFDCLEMTGAYCAGQGYYAIAAKCWQKANEMKQQKCIRVTRNKAYHKTSEKSDNTSVWETFDISVNVAQNFPYPTYGMDVSTRMLQYFTELGDNVINHVAQSYSDAIREGVIPEFNTIQPTCSFMELLKDCGSLICDNIEEETHLKILTKTALVYERLIGYGSWESLRAFKELTSEYLQVGNIIAYVTVLTYCLPYFIKYIPYEEHVDKESYIKNNMINELALTVLNEGVCDILGFDLLMAVFKCFFLDCCATPRKERKFYEFGPMLLAIKRLHDLDKTKEESLRFSQFLKSVVKMNPKNKYGQTLLHHVVPTLSDDQIELFMTYDPSPLKKEICGSTELLKLLLRFGADPNCYDDNGKTPLHFCFETMPLFIWESDDETPNEVVDLLLGAGAHVDCIDAEGNTPIDYSMHHRVRLCPINNRSLQCIAACSVLEHNIPYTEHLTCHLVDFVNLHKKRGKPSLLNFPEHIFG